MKKIVRLTESELVRIVERVINEQGIGSYPSMVDDWKMKLKKKGYSEEKKLPVWMPHLKTDRPEYREYLFFKKPLENDRYYSLMSDGNGIIFIEAPPNYQPVTVKYGFNEILKKNDL